MGNKELKGQRLREARKKLGLTQVDLAKALEISQAAVGRAEQGLSMLKASNLKKLNDIFGISMDYIEKAEGSPIYKKEDLNGLSKIRLISGSVLAGLSASSQIEEHGVEDTFYLPLGSGKEFYAIRVEGRSMEPRIKESSTLIIEEMKDKSDFMNNKVYVIIFQGVAFVKRVEMLLGGEDQGKFEVKSDNEDKVQIVDGSAISAWYKVTHVLHQM